MPDKPTEAAMKAAKAAREFWITTPEYSEKIVRKVDGTLAAIIDHETKLPEKERVLALVCDMDEWCGCKDIANQSGCCVVCMARAVLTKGV